MRLIYREIDKVPSVWIKKAGKVTAKIQKAKTANGRRKIISRNSAWWGKLKKALLEMSSNKCWYTEADDCVSDWHVDHFRPKSVYPWLAFDWKNYRIAGAKPNRKKSNTFPLEEGGLRATMKAQGRREISLLLDPTSAADVQLVTFDEEGKVKPAYPKDPMCCARVDLTREWLDLDTERLIGKRQAIWNDVRDKITELRTYLDSGQSMENGICSATAKARAREIRAATKKKSAFSAVAKACIRANRAEWVYDL
jgi:uncharacterized protein (TIGR02646 family)